MKYLLIDFNNFANIIRFGIFSKSNEKLIQNMDEKEWKQFLAETLIKSLYNYISYLKPDKTVIAIDNNSWRKTFYPLYKENRTEKKEKDEYLDLFYNTINEIKEILKNYTNIKVIDVNGAEGDDIIAVLTEYIFTNDPKAKIIILSTDKDFHQLLKFGNNIKIFDPYKKEYKNIKFSKKELYEKIIKGDRSDNIPNIYPRMKKEIFENIVSDEKYLKKEFENIKKLKEKQIYYLGKLFEEEIPLDLSDNDYKELISIAKEYKEKLKNKDKDKYKLIIKLAKNDGLTESKLFSIIPCFEKEFKRNKKLIELSLDNIPNEITEKILNEYKKKKEKKSEKMYDYLKRNKLKNLLFLKELEMLKKLN
jgi:hypothetical protein